MNSHNPTPCSLLLALPTELRLEIWRQVLGGIVIKISRRNHKPRIPEPALVWTCRQIRAEAMPVFWAHSIFDGRQEAMLRFFGLIGRHNVEQIRHVRHTGHKGLTTLHAIRLTLWILGGAYETMGLRRSALQFPLVREDTGSVWVNLGEALQLREHRPGGEKSNHITTDRGATDLLSTS